MSFFSIALEYIVPTAGWTANYIYLMIYSLLLLLNFLVSLKLQCDTGTGAAWGLISHCWHHKFYNRSLNLVLSAQELALVCLVIQLALLDTLMLVGNLENFLYFHFYFCFYNIWPEINLNGEHDHNSFGLVVVFLIVLLIFQVTGFLVSCSCTIYHTEKKNYMIISTFKR